MRKNLEACVELSKAALDTVEPLLVLFPCHVGAVSSGFHSRFSKYYDDIVFLYETGIRVSEFCGLTLSDIDFVKHEVVIDKQLIKTSKGERIKNLHLANSYVWLPGYTQLPV